MSMTFGEYQEKARTTKIYPDEHKIVYPMMGASNEIGEALGAVKKMLRDGELDVTKLISELGDALWYIANTASDIEISLDDIAKVNLMKLERRQQAGTLRGSGDDR